MAELLSVPLKKATDVDIVKPINNLIQSTYNSTDQSDDFTEALNELRNLRANAIWKTFEKTSLEHIYSYYDQLVSLESKLPPQEVQIPFKWKDAFDKGSLFGGRMSLTVSSLSFERMCVLFNMGSMQSSIAAQQPLDTEDSLKLAAKLLQQAAGVFSYLKANIMQCVHAEPTPDLQPDTLHALAQLMLAQAQEVIAYKCIRDEMKESMVARVCAQTDELYTDAARALGKESVKTLLERDWLSTVSAKQQAFRGLAQLYQGVVCQQAGAVGEQVARLQIAVSSLKAATSRLGSVGPLQEASAKAARLLAEANKDNDFIYHERVPDANSLEPISRAAIAKPLIPGHTDKFGSGGKDLFASLVPLGERRAAAARAARRAELVSAELARLKEATPVLHGTLASLNLPGCLEESGGALPESLRSQAASLRAAGGLAALRGLMAELPALLQRNREVLGEAERMLREEAEADAALRTQFGARWSRTPSDTLTEAFRANAHKYTQIIDNAVQADRIVQQKYDQHKESMALLCGDEDAMLGALPAAERRDGDDSRPREALRGLLREVESLLSSRESLQRGLQDSLETPDQSGAEPAEELQPLRTRVTDSLAQQETLIVRIQEAHTQLTAARGGESNREAALAKLCAAHAAYSDLTNNLSEGVKFYNDLTQLLVSFQSKVSDFCFARRTEKEELLKDLTQDASRASANEQPIVPARREPPPRPAPPAPAQPAAPAPAPAASSALPYPTQPQGMPLPYGAPAYYYPTPVPALYNPYATLPYPHHRAPQPYLPYQLPPQAPGAPPPGYNPYPPPQ